MNDYPYKELPRGARLNAKYFIHLISFNLSHSLKLY